MSYSIEQVTSLIGAHRYGNAATAVGFLLTDSRSLSFPEETLFFALKSERNDGHRYVNDLYRRGVRSFVVESLPEGYADGRDWPGANFLVVTSSLAALQRLAERHRDAFRIPVVGITGSNGKTMVKEWLYQLLMPTMNVTRSPRSYNSQIGVPLSIWQLNASSAIGVFEAGISRVGEMARLTDIIQPTIGVFTSLGMAHQENFVTLEDKCREKFRLFKDCSVLVYPVDNDVVFRTLRQSDFHGEKLGWSVCDSSAAFFVSDIDKTDTSTRVHYIYKGAVEGEYTLPFISEASIENSITCAVTSLYLGLTPEQLAQRMAALEPVAMRLEVKEGRNGCTLINDSYNSDLASLDIALDFMQRRPDHTGRRRTLILSDIDQSGLTEQELNVRLTDLIASRGIDRFIAIGTELASLKHSSSLLHTREHEAMWTAFFDTTEEFMQSECFAALHDEVILIKGARRFHFDRITEQLVEKVHETTLEVNLSAVVANLNWYRSKMRPGTKLVCMIKANAYGAGAVEVAKTLQEHCVDYLAVAVADEGVALRQAGITANIMVMNPEMTSFKTLFDYDLEPEVYSFRLLEALRLAARKEGITGWPIHVKLDTGMHRLGFHPIDDMPALTDFLKGQNALTPRSVFSHFVGSDSDEFDEFSQTQYELFMKGADALQSAFPHHIIRHICNSAGIEHFPDRQLDMCRLGLGLYGINPRDNSLIHNVSTLKTTILQLRHVKAGESIGYSRRTVLDRDSVIADLPIGYADGLNRHLGNRHAYCLVNGQKAEYVGNICMDVCMIDVTGIDCNEGDSVEIFGDNLPVTVLSDVLDTIPYELLTLVSNRVKRVYFEE
ncbi:MAG: bifunctional UDP-N-acetylmuramoyl-tripeptide:D-alanyl-D-alanine ligase/alanine racemase [Prevotellaceae bacterium]|nr:bifunctional UDP-N-acetylmuramoyl-tripeptide:D-alanyl-D-alanine ligase/alanine racemase [Prevotellaceae bacterium]MDO4932341.1 bifunctional UDP-N-acetylmuramoyl-tripeptide:D-alanyl-D-alanine ligase/alanine racemase [Prevotellaceae bacterium]